MFLKDLKCSLLHYGYSHSVLAKQQNSKGFFCNLQCYYVRLLTKGVIIFSILPLNRDLILGLKNIICKGLVFQPCKKSVCKQISSTDSTNYQFLWQLILCVFLHFLYLLWLLTTTPEEDLSVCSEVEKLVKTELLVYTIWWHLRTSPGVRVQFLYSP